MPARTGRQYLNGLREQDREVWLGGERVKDVTTHPGPRRWRACDRFALRHAVRSEVPRRDDLYLADHRRSRRPVVHQSAHARGAGSAPRHDAELGAHHLRHDGPLARLHERHARRLGRRRRLFRARQGRPSSRENIRRYYEYIRENDIVLTHSLINLQRSRNVTGMYNLQEGTALQAVRETSRGLVVRGARVLATLGPISDEIAVYSPRLGQHTEDHSPFALASPFPAARPACASCAATASISAARISTIRSARASRRWTASCSSTTSRCRGSACSCYGDVDLLNGAAQRHALFGAFVASGCGEEPGQVRVRAGARAADDRGARQQASAARRGTHRRADAEHHADAGPDARRRGGCETRRMGRDVPRLRSRSRAPATCS